MEAVEENIDLLRNGEKGRSSFILIAMEVRIKL